ncbi:Hypothetical predicted protein [Xyrichtys novacula]|uniref:Secreted protein n=1 Tax=Xyrichtys novacula TaxID=13765 RepID=A0AAV1EXB9_XYRNO|nr:Hypothetical predicted protein [Xyrichtys novacula]
MQRAPLKSWFVVLSMHTVFLVSEISILLLWEEFKARVRGPDHGCAVPDNFGSSITFISRLPKGCRYVALDKRSHGLFSHHPLPVFVEDVLRVIAVWVWRQNEVNWSSLCSESLISTLGDIQPNRC